MFLMTKAFVGGMRQRRWGRIVNIASDMVSLVPAFTHYIASEAGVVGLTRSLATEFGEHGITANVIAPGQTRTPGTVSRKEIPGGMSQEEFFGVIPICKRSSACKSFPILSARCRFWPAMMPSS